MSEAARESWTCRPCPIDGCSHRVTNADTGGRHLDRVHDEAGRWRANRYRGVDQVDGGDVVIYDITDGRRWVQPDYYVEVGR